ncbi:cobalt-zinc-cadmium resistance protein CzcA [Cnuella takakiae]|uniref:Cobalt-zinc-cadmium resistance protein CzcA n=1 Tax=Cnuella takakiae TaxID=1302690 RepID=A0A1M5ADT9_9BACT|nr:CusA/CzcA family heavy metal efflux RND transporter [Cnuella takakiae]OLY92011.1 acriflavine resistance protein B [Cnuella takakiae]SHF28082.1 cobalt-zinc-cadmium resistance protein CzcA [Cnuella takakiae]
MLNRIIAFSIRNKLIVGLMVVAMCIWGVYNATRLPVDAVPDITNNQVQVITISPALGAADIERLITFPIEQSTRNIPGIIEQRSFSRFGLSLITIVFDDETDVYWARQQVTERLQQVQIPQGLGTPELGPVTTGLGEIFQYVVRPAKGYEQQWTPMELRTVQDWIVRRQLLGTPGVADVSSFGGKLKQYEVAVNTAQLKAYGLTISDVFGALERNNGNTGGAYIEKGPTVLFIRSEGLVNSTADLENTVVKNLPDGTPLLVRNIGTVVLGTATRYGAMTYNDEGEVAGAVVMMLKGENSSRVIRDVKSRIEEIKKTLPQGVIIEPFLDRTKMVTHAISTVERNLVEGALIVVFILVIFLGNLRAGLLVASVIPLAMLFAISMMTLFGVSGNLMSLGALDFGLIVDGAVIIVEAVMHRLHTSREFTPGQKLNQQQMDGAVQQAASRMMNAAVFGQVIILIVYLPILSLQGIEGKMFKPMAQTVAFAIVGAFLLSLTYIPMMSTLVLSKTISHKLTFADRMMHVLERTYRKVLVKALAVPKMVIGVSLALFAGAILVMASLGGEFIPELEEGDFAVDTRVLTGSSLTTTIQATQQTAGILKRQFPEVEKVVTKIGSGEIPTDPMPMEASDMMVILKDKKEWTSAKTFDELAEKMSHALSVVPGVTAGFQFPVQMRFNELMTGSRQDVVCKIFGEDLDTLARHAAALGVLAGSVEGARDLYVETVTGLPQIVVQYNRAALAQYGLAVEDINRVLQSAFAGAVTGQVYEAERRFDLVVRLENEGRQDIADVRNLLVATPTGAQVPLYQVADVQVKVGPNQIQRENAQRRITVGFNVRGRDVQSVVEELQQKIGQKLRLPPGYYITYGGQFENLVAAKQRLSIAVPISLLLIFMLLYFAFNSMQQGLLIYSAIPLSAIGGVLALWLRGMPFSISAGVGFIALFGVAVLNGIVLITEFNNLKVAGMLDLRERILAGTHTRLRPVLMTAAVASLGFLPMALSNGAGAEVQRPLATVVIGGLFTATLLTLLVLPVLYGMVESKTKGKQMNMTPLVLLGCILLPAICSAQQPISLQAALDSAVKNNLSLQAATLNTSGARQLERSATEIPLTTVNGEYGKVNSPLNDSRIAVSQSIAFPVVYRRNRQLLEAQTGIARVQQQLTLLDVKRNITQLYFQMQVAQARRQLLLRADSLFARFLQRQEERFRAGDANIVEKTAAETQRMQVANQLQRLEADFAILQTGLGYWMNSAARYVPEGADLLRTENNLPDTLNGTAHPSLSLRQQEGEVLLRELEVQKSGRLPQVSVGYTNQSFSGTQLINGAEKTFGQANRFSAVQAGVSIPLFTGALKARLLAGRTRYEAARVQYNSALLQYRTTIRQLYQQHERNRQTLAYYRTAALKQADLLEQHATLQYNQGDISYLEWILVINQSISLRAGYLDAVQDWNNNLIELQSYHSLF